MLWPFRRRDVTRRPPPLDATAIVRRARRLRFRVRPGAVSQLAGAYHGARPGIGLTFAELRAYEPGRRRAPSRLERDRAARPAVRAAIRRGAGAVALAGGRRLGEHAVRAGTDHQGRPSRSGGRAAGDGRHSERRPRRLDPGQRSDRARARTGRRRPSPLAARARSGGDTDELAQDQAERRAGTGAADGAARHAGRHQRLRDRRAGRILAARGPAPRHDRLARRRSPRREASRRRACSPSRTPRRVEPAWSIRARPASRSDTNAPRSSASQAFQRWCANSGIQAFTMTTDVDPIVPLIELFSKRATRRGAR